MREWRQVTSGTSPTQFIHTDPRLASEWNVSAMMLTRCKHTHTFRTINRALFWLQETIWWETDQFPSLKTSLRLLRTSSRSTSSSPSASVYQVVLTATERASQMQIQSKQCECETVAETNHEVWRRWQLQHYSPFTLINSPLHLRWNHFHYNLFDIVQPPNHSSHKTWFILSSRQRFNNLETPHKLPDWECGFFHDM